MLNVNIPKNWMWYHSSYNNKFDYVFLLLRLFVHSALKSDTMEISRPIFINDQVHTNATMHKQYISYLCSMPLHQHCWNSCFPLRYLRNQRLYIINVRRHFDWNAGCFCGIEMKEEEIKRTHNQQQQQQQQRLVFFRYTHQNFSDNNYHLVVCVVLFYSSTSQQIHIHILTRFVVALLVRNAHNFTA